MDLKFWSERETIWTFLGSYWFIETSTHHTACLGSSYQYLSSALMGHIDFQIVNINEVPTTKKHHLRVNQKLINTFFKLINTFFKYIPCSRNCSLRENYHYTIKAGNTRATRTLVIFIMQQYSIDFYDVVNGYLQVNSSSNAFA